MTPPSHCVTGGGRGRVSVSDIYNSQVSEMERQQEVPEDTGSWYPTGIFWLFPAYSLSTLAHSGETHHHHRHSPDLHHHHLHPSSAQGSPRGFCVPSAPRSSPRQRQKISNLKIKCPSMDKVFVPSACRLVALFGKAAEPLRGGASLKELDSWDTALTF